MNDLLTIAENRFDSMDNSDDQKEDVGNEEDKNIEQNQENDNDKSDEGKDLEKGEEDESSEEGKEGDDSREEEKDDESDESGDDKKSGEKSEETQSLSNEQLLAELEKRGLKVVDAKDDKTDKADQLFDVKKPSELPDKVWDRMDNVQRYIYDELPYIKAIDKDGNVTEVKTPDQLPDDFEFINPRAQAQFTADVTAQSERAERMQANINEWQKQQKTSQENQKQAQRDIDDVEALQKEGVIPKITAKPGTAEFDKDPGVIRANEILALRNQYNAKGEQVSAYTAGLAYKALHPELYKESEPPKGDKERREVSSKVSGGGRGDKKQADDKNSRPRFPIGTSAQDIADYFEKDLD